MDALRKIRSKSSGRIFFDVISSDETHTIYNSETLKKITKFRIGEWHNGISDLYEVKPMTQSESDKVWNSLSL